mmetsp:Transcript_26690/g.76566  ORF Transcript_26690/g.76566 Transcript_26690/m.76566 type:complete len:449 (+) Transcript_26690:803-2149(+)
MGDLERLPLSVFIGDMCASWKRWSPGPHTLTLDSGWTVPWVSAAGILSPSVKKLRGLVINGGSTPTLPLPPDIVSRPQVEELDAIITGRNVTKATIAELHWVRSHWLAPNAAVRCHAADELTFSTAVFAYMSDTMAAYAPSIAALARAATSVSLRLYWKQGSTFPYLFPDSLLLPDSRDDQAVLFERARRLVAIDIVTVMHGVLSHAAHAFPSVATLVLPMSVVRTGESMAWAMDALGNLGNLRVIEFTLGDSEPSFTSSVPQCDGVGPYLHLKGVFSPSVCSLAFEEQTGQSDQREGLRERIRHITLEVDLSDDVHGEPWVYCGDVAGACLAAIHNFPCLDRIVLECREIVWPEGDRGGKEDSSSYIFDALHTTPCWYLRSVDALGRVRSRLFFLALHGLGWEAIELPPLGYDCRVEVRRIGAVDDPTQRRITDCFLPATRSDLSHM